MRVYFTLLRRELGAYFLSLTAYITIAIVLLLLGLSFVDILDKLNNEATDAPLTEFFYSTLYFWIILLLTAPVITMRLFALEKFSGTYETLMTSPVGEVSVVLAKFSGALIFYMIIWAPLIAYMALVERFVEGQSAVIDPRALACTYLGILLIGSIYMSMGCLASALTRSQIIAAMLSYGAGLSLFLLSLRAMMPLPTGGWQTAFFKHVAMTDHMQEFARGRIDIRALVFALSMTVLFLFFTCKAVEARRWK